MNNKKRFHSPLSPLHEGGSPASRGGGRKLLNTFFVQLKNWDPDPFMIRIPILLLLLLIPLSASALSVSVSRGGGEAGLIGHWALSAEAETHKSLTYDAWTNSVYSGRSTGTSYFTQTGDDIDITTSNGGWPGVGRNFSTSVKGKYRVRATFTVNNGRGRWGYHLYNGSTRLDYNAPTDSESWFPSYYSGVGYNYGSDLVSEVKNMDTIIDLSGAPDFDAIHFVIQSESGTASPYVEFDQTTVSIKEITAGDSTPNDNHGTLIGTNSYTTNYKGLTDKALSFNGSTDYVDLGDVGNPSAGTIALWFQKPNINTGADYLIDGRGTGNFWFLQDYVSGACTDSEGNICFNGLVEIQSSNLSNNTWHHVTITTNSTESKIYLNGALIDTGSGLDPDFRSLRIGARYTASSFFTGSFSDVRVYDRSLTATEVLTLYEGSESSMSTGNLNQGLVGHWPLTSRSKTTADNPVTNGTFDADTAWGKQAGWSISGGVASCDGSQSSRTYISQGIGLVSDTKYRISFDLTVNAGFFSIGDSNVYLVGSGSSGLTTSGHYDFEVTTGTSLSNSSIHLHGFNNFNGTVDNFIMTKVLAGDQTANDNHGTLYEGTNIRNQGYYFDGTDDSIGITDLNSVSFERSITINAWVKQDSSTNKVVIGRGQISGGSVRDYGIEIWNNHFQFSREEDDDDDFVCAGTTAVTPGTWYHVVGIDDGTNFYIYVNGQLDRGAACSFPGFVATTESNMDLKIGTQSSSYNGIPFFNGSIADARIYDRALSSTEVTNLYNGSDIASPIAHWPLSSGAGDISGNNNHGIVSGAKLIGDSVHFDGGVGTGNGDYIQVPTQTIDLTSFTVGFWAKRDSLTTDDATNTTSALRILYGSASYKFLDYRISGGKFLLRGERDINSEYWGNYTTNVVADTDWHYVTITGDNNVFDIYMDGVFQGTDNDSSAGYTSNTCTFSGIGQGYPTAHTSYGSYFEGNMKDLRLYDRPLSATEVASLYDQGHTKQQKASVGNINKGLIGYWPLDSQSLRSSTSVGDATPYDNHGTFSGDPVVGSEYTTFDGGDYISTTLQLPITDDFTFSAWVNKTTDANRNTIIGSWSPWIWHIHDQEAQFETLIGSVETHVSGLTAIPYNTWTHMAVEYIYADDAIRFYVNGEFDNEVILSGKLDSSSGYVHLGGYPDWRLHGSIDEARVYNRALSDKEIKMLYDGGR